MTDFLISAAGGLGIAGAAIAAKRARLRREARSALRRIAAVEPRRRQRKSLLAGPLARLEPMPLMSWISGRVGRLYPQISFSDAVVFLGCGALAGSLFGALLLGGPLILAGGVAGPIVADAVMVRMGGWRSGRLAQQLPDGLFVQASALRAGHSLLSSVAAVSAEASPPLSEEARRVVREVELGGSVETSLEGLAQRVQGKDVELWTTAMLVHKRTGGNLAAVVEALGERLRERANTLAEIRSLTAQGRLSGLVVTAAPAGFFLMLTVTSREQMSVLYSTPLGFALLAGGVCLDVLGFMWIRRIVRIRE